MWAQPVLSRSTLCRHRFGQFVEVTRAQTVTHPEGSGPLGPGPDADLVRTEATEDGAVRDVVGSLLRVEIERPHCTRHKTRRQEHSPYRNLHGVTLRTNALWHGCHRRDT